MLRYRMNKLIHILEAEDTSALRAALASDKYLQALKALEDQGCIKVTRAWDGDLLNVQLLNHYVTYRLSRQELWKNRIGGFIAGIISGVIVSVVSAIAIGLLPM